MKRSISLLSVLAFVLAFSGSVFAQETVTAEANVLTQISTSSKTILNFANIEPDLDPNPTINPVDGSTSNIVSGTPTVGQLVLSGEASQSFIIDFTKSDLTNGDGSETITYSPNVVGKSGDGSGSSNASDFTTGGNQVTINTGSNSNTDISFSSGGNFTLWLGGSLSGGTVSSGSYTAEQSFTVSYL